MQSQTESTDPQETPQPSEYMSGSNEDDTTGPLFDNNQPSGVYDDQFDRSRRRSASPSELKDAENYNKPSAEPNKNARTEADKVNGLGNNAASTAKAAAAAATGGIAGLAGAALGLAKSKKGIAGGGIVGGGIGLLVFVSMFAGNFELQNVSQNFFGPFNRLGNFSMSQRTSKSFMRAVRLTNKDSVRFSRINEAFKSDEFVSGLREKGFDVTRNSEGTITSLEHVDSGRSISFADESFSRDLNTFLEGSTGKIIANDLAEASGVRARMWRGSVIDRVWSKYGYRFNPWLDEKSPKEKPGETPEETLARRQEQANTNESNGSSSISSKEKTDEQLAEEGKDPNSKDLPQVDDAAKNIDGAQDFLNTLDSNPLAGDGAISGINDSLKDTISGSADDLVGDLAKNDTAALSIVTEALKANVSKLPATSTTSLLESFNIVGSTQIGCRIKGHADFVLHMKTLLLGVELARFGVRILTAADNQKAGIAQSEGIKLLMIKLHTPNSKNGLTWLNTGGMQGVLGNSDATVDKNHLAKFSLSRNGGGVLSKINTAVSAITGLATIGVPVSNGTCKFVNNKLVVGAGFIVGGFAAIFSAGTNTVKEFAKNFALMSLLELSLQLSKPILIKMVTHQLFTFAEPSDEVGDGAAAGLGAVRTIQGSANGMRPITNAKAVALDQQYQEQKRMLASRQSVFERYFDLHNPESVTSKTGIQLAAITPLWRSKITTGITSLFSGFGLFKPVLAALVNRPALAYAQSSANNQCDDPFIKDNDLVTDAFCFPITADTPDLDVDQVQIALQAAGQIDSEGQPKDKSDFQKFIKQCFSGTASPLLAGVREDGTSDPYQTTSECFSDDVQHQQFAAYYGYLVDLTNLEGKPYN